MNNLEPQFLNYYFFNIINYITVIDFLLAVINYNYYTSNWIKYKIQNTDSIPIKKKISTHQLCFQQAKENVLQN